MDGTFNQTAPLVRLIPSSHCFSFDLKSATDRWSLLYLFEIVALLFDRSFASSVVNSYYGSWPLFAFSHHLLVWWSAEQVRPGVRFTGYAVLAEFAKRFLVKDMRTQLHRPSLRYSLLKYRYTSLRFVRWVEKYETLPRQSQGSGFKPKTFTPNYKSAAAGSSSKPSSASPKVDIAAIEEATSGKEKRKRGAVNPWSIPLSKIFSKCRRVGLLDSVKPVVPPAPEYKKNFCSYYVLGGHTTDECGGLIREIKQLIKDDRFGNQVNMVQSGLPENFVLDQICGANETVKVGAVSASANKVQKIRFPDIESEDEEIQFVPKAVSEQAVKNKATRISLTDCDSEEEGFINFHEQPKWPVVSKIAGTFLSTADGQVNNLTRSGRLDIIDLNERSEANQSVQNQSSGKAVQGQQPGQPARSSAQVSVPSAPVAAQLPSPVKVDDPVVDQLKKTPARVSIWQLLMESAPVTGVTADEVVDPAQKTPVITFSDADLPPGTTKLSLNICPLKILPYLSLTEDMLQKSATVIRAYDDSKRSVLGTFETDVEVQGIKSKVMFTVIDIPRLVRSERERDQRERVDLSRLYKLFEAK
ncbi:mitovirus RNA-dependent RNA polymerase [Striga asiatica]|uniref:Mitovirus RNA-dependent RNA polymerase n=1 Tax=Striga asiatica TaxID=4170 RepID=A0A5A7QRT8_STRAF|nr:mitovirus RNA-dependent RNA polymerase [Striga asiatica]